MIGHPERGDTVEAWIRAKRDKAWRTGDAPPRWHVLDDLLDEYRLHADTGTHLNEEAAG